MTGQQCYDYYLSPLYFIEDLNYQPPHLEKPGTVKTRDLLRAILDSKPISSDFIQEAYNWVEEHRRGREQFFLQDVELRLEHLQKFPLIGRLYRGRYRRLLIPRYPFGIFYVVESNRIVIHAVPDLRQDPEKIRARFSE